MARRILLALFTAPLVGLGWLAATARSTPAPGPPLAGIAPFTVGVWFAVCPTGGFWGPYTTADACRAKLEVAKETCLAPLAAPNTPNPAFVAIAEVCRDAYNAQRCACQYEIAVPGVPILPHHLRAAQ